MNRLREFRNKYRISQTNAAKLFGVTSGAWSKWEGGKECHIAFVTENVELLIEANLDDVIADEIPRKLYGVGGAGTLWWIIRSTGKKNRTKKAPSNENNLEPHPDPSVNPVPSGTPAAPGGQDPPNV